MMIATSPQRLAFLAFLLEGYSALAADAPQTEIQQAVAAATLEAAIPASNDAKYQVLGMMGNAATTRYLQEFDDGTGLQHLSAEELSQRFFQELSVAELVSASCT